MTKMLKIDYLSDLHIDHQIKNITKPKVEKYIDTYVKPKDGDVLVLAGDIVEHTDSLGFVLEAFKRYYKDIIYVHGNHECYNYKYKYLSSEDKLDELIATCKAHDVHYLDGGVVEIKGVKFGGGPAWYDFSYGIKLGNTYKDMLSYWKEYMSDGDLIGDHFMTPPYGRSKEAILDFKRFSEDRINRVKALSESVDVMVTHIGPDVPDNLPASYNNAATGFYYFEGSKEINAEIAPELWVFGHTHIHYDYTRNNTRLVCNPFGYPNEMKGKVRGVKRIEFVKTTEVKDAV